MKRLDGIDILRGTAVIAVIVYHFYMLLGFTQVPSFTYIKHFGSIGVPLFFVISGYLIFRSIARSITPKGIKKGILDYTLHRLFRILPAYYFNLFVVLLIAAFFISHAFYYSSSFFRQFFAHMTFSTYFIYKDAGFGVNGAYWTLGIEMLWYVIAPLLFIFFKRTWMLILVILASLGYIWTIDAGLLDTVVGIDPVTTPNYTLLQYYYYTQIPGQINFFIAGILIYKYHTLTPRYPLLIASVILVTFIGIMGYFDFQHNFLPYHLLHVTVVTLLFVLLYESRIKGAGLLEWIGKISYSLYLWHMPVLYVMQKSNILQYRSIPETVLFFLFVLFSLSSMSYYFIEEGGFTLRKKLTQHLWGQTAPQRKSA